jgi:hypothetical protein
MKTGMFSAGLFLTAFLVHWMVWRVRVPRRQTAALLLIFLGALPVGLTVAGYLPRLADWAPHHFWEIWQVAVCHVALSLAYIVAYSAIEERSPSMTLAQYVAAAGPRGRSRDEMVALLDGVVSLRGRLDAMRRDGMVTEVDGVCRLSAKGRRLARLFTFWRRLLRIEVGG